MWRERERDYRVRADNGGSVWNRLINGFSDKKKRFLITFAQKKNKYKKKRFLSNYQGAGTYEFLEGFQLWQLQGLNY